MPLLVFPATAHGSMIAQGGVCDGDVAEKENFHHSQLTIDNSPLPIHHCLPSSQYNNKFICTFG